MTTATVGYTTLTIPDEKDLTIKVLEEDGSTGLVSLNVTQYAALVAGTRGGRMVDDEDDSKTVIAEIVVTDNVTWEENGYPRSNKELGSALGYALEEAITAFAEKIIEESS